MSQEKIGNRWFVVLGAVLIQLCLGAIYAWSVFTPSLIAAGWSKLDTQIVFSVGLATFALVMAFAGKKLPIWRPHRLARMSALTLGMGYILAGVFGGTGFWPVLIGVGVVGCAGIGMGYVVPIAVGMRWFPDHKGLITGLAVAGFGFGALGWVKMAGEWGHLLDNLGLANTFMIYGVIFILLGFLGSLWMHMPSAQWAPPGYTAPSPLAGEGSENFSISDMLHTPQFYLIFLTFTVSAGAGLMAIGLMKLYPMEALQAAGYSKVEASVISGTAMAVFFSLSNGIGRIVWGMVSDWLGRKRSVIIMTLSQGLVFFFFSSMAGHEAWLYLGATLIGFNFGGNFALFPALTADEFGNKAVGQNYPLIFLSYGVGGILFPILGGVLGDLGNFPLAFSICGVACILGAGCSAILFPPHLDEAHKPMSFHGFLHQFHVFDHERKPGDR
ncbi:MAG: OFA family MFS transporter [Magnetococcales bacterium]|nr:OFA family MFS transporter [Magnetococcales bacterium]MBF0151416.1 OFA family MFS transporter [Magnetococcales bacterium]MBF0173534.1 OFA family MFS transporter [Magnetococcales bacterium]MBF0632432.1 OFA family MFS transporter [Magnetococcales bacterium]